VEKCPINLCFVYFDMNLSVPDGFLDVYPTRRESFGFSSVLGGGGGYWAGEDATNEDWIEPG
jgi:hypothetical protein